ncbi:hypothetical protein [Lactococcus lactis]|uniref:hypothetical protein n=1 Tax=Lactococcus lactis TaxID=1358 RepID=UPI003D0AF232
MGDRIEAGDYSNNTIGDYNQITNNFYDTIIPNRTIVYELCMIIADSDIEVGDYDIRSNVSWTDKLKRNNVESYLEIFDAYCDVYNDFEEILVSQYDKRDKLIRKIQHIYLSVIIKNKSKKDDGDWILDEVYNVLRNTVIQANYNPEEIIIEDIERTIILIMFYAITKCQLLKR